MSRALLVRACGAVVVSLGITAAVVACSSSSTKSTETNHDGGGGGVDGGKTHTDGSTGKTDAKGHADTGGKTGTDASSDAAGDSGIAPALVLPAPTADITWGDNTTFIDQTQTMALNPVIGTLDPLDGGTSQTITLPAAMVTSMGLDLSAGRIVVIYGEVMRLIDGSSTDGAGNLVLATSDTTFEAAATDANLVWEQATELTPEAAIAAMGDTGQIHIDHKKGLTVSKGMLNYTAVFGAYSLDITLTLHGSNADVNIDVTKPGTMEEFTVTGTIQRSVATHMVGVTGHKLQNYSTSNAGVAGKIILTAIAAGSGTDSFNQTLDVPIFKFPLLVGPIPVVQSLSAQFVIMGTVTPQSSVNVSAEFDYDSTLGISYAGGSFSTTGNEGSPTITANGTPHSASPGDVAFNAGLGFPRLSLSFLGGTLVGSMQPAFLVGGSYTFFPACNTANTEFIASVDYSISILGIIPVSSGSKVLFQQEKTLLEAPAGCADGGT